MDNLTKKLLHSSTKVFNFAIIMYNYILNSMKKFLLFILFFGLTFGFNTSVKAQSVIEHTSINQKNDDGILVVYPNPAREFVVLKLKDSSLKIKSVSFYSILGVSVLTTNVNMNAAEVSLEKLRPGKYLMKYTLSDGTTKVKQIIKQ